MATILTLYSKSPGFKFLFGYRRLDYISQLYVISLQALSGFLMMMTQNGKLLYISDNAAEYLGHSMVSTSDCVHVDAVYRLRLARKQIHILCVLATFSIRNNTGHTQKNGAASKVNHF
jgi:hypothetical protein